MTNDIEAAARACRRSGATPGTQSEFAQDCFNDGVEAMRSALAHAARGEGGPPPWHAPCVLCGHRQSAHNTDTGPCSKCGCDCAAFRPTPPPATGEAKWPEIRDSGGRTDFALTPATGEAGTRGEVEKARAAVIDAAKAFRAHDETYLIANYENVAEEGERQRLIVKMLVAVDALLAAERSENGGDRG